LSDFLIAETRTFQKRISSPEYRKLYKKITEAIYPTLRNNPFYGSQIKRLKGELQGIYRYRIGDYRLFYLVDRNRSLVFILDFKHRKSSYR
jgi:mRNA interferase RelE/StbE